MKSIEINQRYCPFSHRLGVCCLLPGSSYALRFYPGKIELYQWEHSQKLAVETFTLSVIGPVQKFTVQQDLERQQVFVSMQTQEGYLSYLIKAKEGKPLLELKKAPGDFLEVEHYGVKVKECFSLIDKVNVEPVSPVYNNWERLSFGSHKSPCWEKLYERQTNNELFPYWFHLGQQYNIGGEVEVEGSLLGECHQVVLDKDVMQVEPAFQRLFKALFHDMFLPYSHDQAFQGILTPTSQETSPLQILTKSASLIRSQLISYEKETLYLLPCLSPEFHCGRFVNVSIKKLGKVSLQWSKKLLNRCVLDVEENKDCHLHLQSGIRSFRLRKDKKDKGVIVSVDETLSLSAGKKYILDRFEK
jgi:hypothetical protein